MKIARAVLDNCHQASGTVVVIDVIRAFTTAAFAFDAGAEKITLVSTVEEAFVLRRQYDGSLIIGEVDALPVQGFDLWNSPTEIYGKNLAGRHLIQRTTSGTQGVVRSRDAEILLASSLCCARATADYIKRYHPENVTFVATGVRPGGYSDEDVACVDYIEALLQGKPIDKAAIVKRVEESKAGRKYMDANVPQFPKADVEKSLEFDRFDFAMVVHREAGQSVMKPVYLR